jgi:tape measure domain-containing protein
MANSPRDVAFKVSVQTLGTEGIKNLQQQLSDLAKEGGNASPEFKQLADEIQRLGEQAKVVNAIDKLSAEIAEVAKSEGEASTKTSELRSELSSLSDTTERLRTAENNLKTELDEAKRALFDKGQELRKFKNEATDSEKKTEEFKNTVKAFNAELIEGQTKARDLADAYSKVKQETKEAANSESDLAQKLNQVAAAASKLKDELRSKNETLSTSKGQLEGLGSSYESIEKAEGSLLQRYTELAGAIEREAQEIRKNKQEQLEAAQAAKQAAEEKLAAEQEYARKLAVLNAQVSSAAKQAAEERKAAEQEYGNKVDIINAEIAAAHKRVADVAAAEAKKSADERIAAEKAAAEAAKRTAEERKAAEQEYGNRVGVINAQIAAARKAAEQAAVASSKQAAEEKIAAEKAVVDAANQTANALSAVGVRSSAQIKADIQKVSDSLDLLKRSGTLTGAELDAAFKQGQKQINELERELRGVNNQLTITDRTVNLFKTSMGQFTAGNLIANGVMTLAEKVGELGRAFITTMVQGDQMNRAMNAIYKDTKLAASQIDFLRKASVETGVSFSEISTEFVKFSASMNSANIPLEQSNALFKAVTSAASTLGLGTEATAGSLNALAQMASKGTVSMEELRQQLGDRLPGVMGLTSKAMGITEGQLVKLVESGQLATRDFIVPFTKGLQELKGDTDGVVPTINKFKSVLAGIAQDIGAAGALDALKGVVIGLGTALTGVSVILSGFFEVVFGGIKAVGILTGGLLTLTNPLEALKDLLGESSERFSKQREQVLLLAKGTDEATKAELAKWEATKKAIEESKNAETITNAYSQALNLSKIAADLTADSALKGAGSFTQFNVAVKEAIEKQELQSEAANRNIRAMEELGKEIVRIAELSGDETLIREAQTKALDLQVEASEKLAASKKAEVDLLVLQSQRLQEDAKERGLSAEQIKSQKDAIEKKLIPAQSELEEIKKTTDALRAEALERKLVSEALKDNSANVGKYADEVTGAKNTLKEIEAQERQGILTKEDVKYAQEMLSRATYLYNDAIKDSIEKLDRDTQAKKANLDISSAKASVGQTHYEALAKEARAVNDTAMATYYDIEAKKQSIKVLELKMEMERLQNAAALAEIELKRKLIDSTTDEGRAKLQLLDIERQMIEIKNINTNAIKYQISSIESEITALRTGNATRDASKSANDSDTSARLKNASATNAQTDALQRQAAAEKAAAAAAAEKGESDFDKKMGTKISIGADNNMPFHIRDKLNAGTLTEDDIKNMDTVAKIVRMNAQALRGVPRSAMAYKDDIQWLSVAAKLEEKSEQLKKEKALREAKQTLGITSKEATDKKNSAAELLYSNRFSLTAAEQEQLKKIPKFASGGTHKGGIRLVGENGPELEVTGPSRIIDANKTRSLLKDAEANEQILLKSIADIEKKIKELEDEARQQEWIGRTRGFSRSLEAGINKLLDDAHQEKILLSEHKGRLMANAKAKREQELLLLSAPPPPQKTDSQRAEDAARLERERIDAHIKAMGAKSTPPTTNQPTVGKTYTVNINLNGKSAAINTASDSDAQRLTELLKSLENVSRRTF